jgi:hypothetical protein
MCLVCVCVCVCVTVRDGKCVVKWIRTFGRKDFGPF